MGEAEEDVSRLCEATAEACEAEAADETDAETASDTETDVVALSEAALEA